MNSRAFSAVIRAQVRGYEPPPVEPPVGDILGRSKPPRAMPRAPALGMNAAIRGAWRERWERQRDLTEHEARVEDLLDA
ncbi:MAG: hypothetical protein ACXVH3_32365 [Solirubrobacteraceae bacterium]